jgi:hypothetical protein
MVQHALNHSSGFRSIFQCLHSVMEYSPSRGFNVDLKGYTKWLKAHQVKRLETYKI